MRTRRRFFLFIGFWYEMENQCTSFTRKYLLVATTIQGGFGLGGFLPTIKVKVDRGRQGCQLFFEDHWGFPRIVEGTLGDIKVV